MRNLTFLNNNQLLKKHALPLSKFTLRILALNNYLVVFVHPVHKA